MSAFDGCTQADYVAAAHALSAAMESHAKVRKTHNNEGYKALLDVSEFHDRCLVLARSIATERGNYWLPDHSQPEPVDGNGQP